MEPSSDAERWMEYPELAGYFISSHGRVAGLLLGSSSRGLWRYSLMRDGKTYYKSRAALLATIAAAAPDEWVGLPYFPRYQISGDGRVRRFLGAFDNGSGYLHAKFGGSKRGIHILVCTTFHGPKPFAGAEVAHWDGDNSNNSAANLRWVSHAENEADKWRHGTGDKRGLRNPMGRLSDERVLAIRARKAAGEHATALAAEFGVHVNTIYAISSGKKRRFVPAAA